MDIRKEFIDFFESKNHTKIDPIPLVPNDKSLLFVNAGMVQFKDIFIQNAPIPSYTKAVTCQPCIRAGGKHNDLENVGYTSRHHTLFEMLGNFSFNDYFKEEAINYAWAFITKNLKLSIDNLWVSVHKNDQESYNLWEKYINKNRIKRFEDKDNFWSMGDTGPCGYCSEIFYDQGEKNFKDNEDYLGGQGDRFLEIWNLVFVEYNRDIKGNLTKLNNPSIDTGMGLERVMAIKEGVLNNFESSNFKPIIEKLEKITNKTITNKTISSYRVIADHLRATSFILCDGVLFNNEGRGYVLRRILRRAVRHGYLLGLEEPFMAKLFNTLCNILGQYYPQLIEKSSYIKEQLTIEEERFFKTIKKGISLFNEEVQNNSNKILKGSIAFKLYDTFGFPLDLTQDMLKEKNMRLDINEFNKLMQQQKTKAKQSWKNDSNEDIKSFKKLNDKYPKNIFLGYDNTKLETKIVTILDDNFEEIDLIDKNKQGWVLFNKTVFYPQGGGQIGDIGEIKYNNKLIAIVKDTQKFNDIILSKINTIENISKNMIVNTNVLKRDQIRIHHSATHLLQYALKKVLGSNITQAGSYNDSSKLRFDFTYNKSITNIEIEKVENTVNEMIQNNIETKIQELPIEEAKKSGAISMFGEKYSNIVRVVDFGGLSIEFCGGTHIKNTSQIGSFYITKESSVSSGVRRIEAVCGSSAIQYSKSIINELNEIKDELKTNEVIKSIKKLKENLKTLKNEISNIQIQSTKKLNEIIVNDIKVVVDTIENGDIKKIIDDIKNKNEKIVVVLIQIKDNKVLLAAGNKNTNIKCGNLIKNIAPILGGGGGGRDDFAQAGGKNIAQVNNAITKAIEYIKSNL
jgi:alanyl-tRNA synthetase